MSTVGVFIDGDNILPSSTGALFNIISSKGFVEFINLYADFSLPSNSEWKYHAINHAIECYQVWTPTGRMKNTTDFRIVMDLVKTVCTNPNVGTYIICSGDADFITTANDIRRQGKRVIVISQSKRTTSDMWEQYCDEVIFLDDYQSKQQELFKESQQALLDILKDHQGELDIANVGGELRKKNPKFNNEYFGIKYHWQFIEYIGEDKVSILRGTRMKAKLL